MRRVDKSAFAAEGVVVMAEPYIRRVDLQNEAERARVASFLKDGFDLGFDEDTEATLVLEKGGELLATASFAGSVIKQVAIDESLRGQGWASPLLEKLIQEMVARRRLHLFVFTKPGMTDIFTSMGFKKVAGLFTEAVLLEWGAGGIERYKKELGAYRTGGAGNVSALVVNCNPFTKGHRHLVETASRESDGVYVFVVETDKSLFPFEKRFELVKKGTQDLKNVTVLPGGPYIISPATFPAYFTREEDLARVQTELDAEIFAEHIAPALHIGARYVGTEPYCAVTRAYNEALGKILNLYHMDLRILRRFELGGRIVSASAVRQALREGDMETVKSMVPQTTWEYLASKEAEDVIEKIRRNQSRH